MARRFVTIPAGTFTDTTDWESVSLEPDELPDSRYIDLDPSQPATITKDGGNLVSAWRNSIGAEALDTPAVAAAYPLWVAAALNGYPVVDCNSSATKTLYSSADILHNLSAGYSWAVVVENLAVPSTCIIWSTSSTAASTTSVFSVANRTWRNNGTESANWGTGILASGWHILIGSYNPTGFKLNVWENGVNPGEFTSAGAPGTGRKLVLAWNTVGGGRVRFARVMIFNKTLTSTEVLSVHRIFKSQYAL